MFKYNQRVIKTFMEHISPVEYGNLVQFFVDTENGLKPFFFAWRPEGDPVDVLPMRLRGARNAPYQGGVLRRWEFEAEEVVGVRAI